MGGIDPPSRQGECLMFPLHHIPFYKKVEKAGIDPAALTVLVSNATIAPHPRSNVLDSVAEWLRRHITNLIPLGNVGPIPTGVVINFYFKNKSEIAASGRYSAVLSECSIQLSY